ncbi:SagB/ThcOx family dehydrogenase, partial [Heyndrickxia sporothermodurans]
YNSYPSAGGFYDVYSYLFINNVESYPSGIYHYNFSDEKPKCIYAGDIKAFVETANIQHEIINKSSFFILFCADTRRYIKKYGERGYRFLMLETGHISQNVINLSSSLNIGNFSCGGYLDNRYKDVLELNDYEIITHQLALGINII